MTGMIWDDLQRVRHAIAHVIDEDAHRRLCEAFSALEYSIVENFWVEKPQNGRFGIKDAEFLGKAAQIEQVSEAERIAEHERQVALLDLPWAVGGKPGPDAGQQTTVRCGNKVSRVIRPPEAEADPALEYWYSEAEEQTASRIAEKDAEAEKLARLAEHERKAARLVTMLPKPPNWDYSFLGNAVTNRRD